MDSQPVFITVDNSKIIVPDNTSHDGAAPSMWGIFIGDDKTVPDLFYCTFCYRRIEARFPRYDKVLDRTNEADVPENGGWKSPCCIKQVKRIK